MISEAARTRTTARRESALTQLDQSILAKAFRGELVPQDPRDEPATELLKRIRTSRDEASTRPKASRQTNPVSTADKVRLDRGRVALDILLLLEAWDKPVSIRLLEPALILMRRDDLRQVFSKARKSKRKPKQVSPPLPSLDLIYQNLVKKGRIRRVGTTGYELAKSYASGMATDADREKANEAINALTTLMEKRGLDEEQAMHAIAAKVTEAYELAAD